MIPAGRSVDVIQVAEDLDAAFSAEYPEIHRCRSPVIIEAVEQLEGLVGRPEHHDELRLRSALIIFATKREAIPAASYADHLVKKVARESAPFGRTFSFALHNAWVDEALHTQFLVCCVPDDSAAKRVGKRARRSGHLAGAWSARVFHGGPAAELANKVVVQFALRTRDAPVAAIKAVRPLSTSDYFSTAVDFEYAAALGWRVMHAAELPKREMPDNGSGELNRIAGRAMELEAGDLARIAPRIADAEIRHTKVLWQMAAGKTIGHPAMVASLATIHKAFVPPEFRLGSTTSGASTIRTATVAEQPRAIEEALEAARGRWRPSEARRVTLLIGDCPTSTAEAMISCFPDSAAWTYRTIGAPVGTGFSPADLMDRYSFELEAGCARASWPNAWADADIRIVLSDVSRRVQPELSLGALARLVEVLPEELRSPFRRMPDPRHHALMWLLEQHPPHLAIVFGPEGLVLGDSRFRPVVFDEMFVRDQRLRRSTWLEEAVRWFGPLSESA